jgi:hypothetical protein
VAARDHAWLDVTYYQNPRSFHLAKPTVSQISRLTDDTMKPTSHQSPKVPTVP